ncbi:MAG TPA: MFS transporter [Bryobacteraceae bacterium]|nr:MFS transporter [Bryobacteraceae bacterium]
MTQLPLRSWLTLIACFVILMVAFSFGLFSLPQFYPSLVRSFHWTRASAAAGGSIVLLLVGVLSPAVGALVDRFQPKAVLLGGMCLVGLALALLSTAQSRAEYYAFCVILGAGTSAVSILPNSILIGPWFTRNRGLAVGFVNAGIGLGGVAPAITAAEIARRGVPGAFLFLSACIAIPLLLTLAIVRKEDGGRPTAARSPSARELARMPMFWIFGVCLFFTAHAMLGIQQNLVLYLTGEGVPTQRAAHVLSIALMAAAAGKLISGVLADRFSARAGMLFSISCVGLGILALLETPAQSNLLDPLAVVFGMGYGGIFNASPTIVFEHFGTHQVGKSLGLFYVFFGLGTATGGTLAALLADQTRSYAAPFTVDLALAAAALLVMMASGRQTQPAGRLTLSKAT